MSEMLNDSKNPPPHPVTQGSVSKLTWYGSKGHYFGDVNIPPPSTKSYKVNIGLEGSAISQR